MLASLHRPKPRGVLMFLFLIY